MACSKVEKKEAPPEPKERARIVAWIVGKSVEEQEWIFNPLTRQYTDKTTLIHNNTSLCAPKAALNV